MFWKCGMGANKLRKYLFYNPRKIKIYLILHSLIFSYLILSYRCDLIWCYLMWFELSWSDVLGLDVIWCVMIWCVVIWTELIWCVVTWCDVVWCDVILSDLIISHPILSYLILSDPIQYVIPGENAYPLDVAPLPQCSRTEIRAFTRAARDLGVQYVGLCCGNSSHCLRELALAFGKHPSSYNYAPELRHSLAVGDVENMSARVQKNQLHLLGRKANKNTSFCCDCLFVLCGVVCWVCSVMLNKGISLFVNFGWLVGCRLVWFSLL